MPSSSSRRRRARSKAQRRAPPPGAHRSRSPPATKRLTLRLRSGIAVGSGEGSLLRPPASLDSDAGNGR
jgi:hypothetical protein